MITKNGTYPYAFVKQIFVVVNQVIVVAVKLSKLYTVHIYCRGIAYIELPNYTTETLIEVYG